ncbi:unnamed protein product [Musa textilis]
MATMLRSLGARRHLWSSSSLARSYSSHQPTALVSKRFTRSPPLRIHPISDCSSLFLNRLRRAFSCNVNQLPGIADPDIEAAFKDLMTMNWDEIPDRSHITQKRLFLRPLEIRLVKRLWQMPFVQQRHQLNFLGF